VSNLSRWVVIIMDKVKEIISVFLKESPENITEKTRIDKQVIPGSVLIHRMYSELRHHGFEVTDISSIVTFGDLQRSLSGKDKSKILESVTITPPTSRADFSYDVDTGFIGIDMESSENLPSTNDFHSHQFYKDNFSKREIGYCSSKKDPRSCFSGRFAAKEAIVKADNTYRCKPFSELEIEISKNGRPIFRDFNLSISHNKLGDNSLSIAIAQKRSIICKYEKNSNTSSVNPTSLEDEGLHQPPKKRDKKESISHTIISIVLASGLSVAIFYIISNSNLN